jgi:poly-gamma-glutamate synthesis protein (capsule biosynthesis protein)
VKPAARLANLETSVTTSSDFWPGKGINYRMHPANVGCLQAAHLDACSLANNHVLDFGRAGLIETLDVLGGAGIRVAGAGRDLDEARRPARIALGNGANLLVFAFGSESSGIPPDWAAGPSRAGVHLLPDLSLRTADDIAEHVRSARHPGDVAIASIHWGSNWGFDVAADEVAFAHRLIDGGVDLVHGHSSHHVRPIEIYDGKLILYGCGDLVTDYEGITGHDEWRGDLGAMYLATISPHDGTLTGLHLVPMQMRRMRLARPEWSDAEWLRATLNRISRPFGARFARDAAGTLALQEQHAGVRP